MFAESEIAQQVKTFIIDNFMFGVDGNLRDTDSFIGNGLIDSTGVLELVSFLEEQYSVEILDQELVPENLDSIAAVSGFVQRKLLAVSS